MKKEKTGLKVPKQRKHHPLVETLISLKGNQRSCVLTEPLWDIPYNLYAPYVSLYMAALGLGDAQIGGIASIGLALQFVWALLSGAITDKLGRRITTVIFDILAWSVPMIFWATAQGYWYFLGAAVFNAIWRVTNNSWSCLLVEDGDDSQLVRIYTLVDITTFVAGMVSPVVGLFIDKYTLVPTMRAIYWLTFAMMTAKFIILFIFSKESSVGRQRMKETKDTHLLSVFAGSLGVLKQLLRSRATVLSMLLLALMTCFTTVQGTFWSLFVSEKYAVSDALMSVFPMVRAIVIMTIYFTVTPRIRTDRVKRPLLVALGAHGVWIVLLLICMPLGKGGLPAVFIAVVFESVASGLFGPLGSSLLALNVDAKERARIYSIAYALILAVSAPTGWIAGMLSKVDRSLPLAFNLTLIAALAVVAFLFVKNQEKMQALL